MKAQIYWYVPEKIIISRVSGVFGHRDLLAANQKLHKMLDSSKNQTVHIITDMSALERLELSTREAVQLSSTTHHPNLGHLVVCEVPPRLKAIARVFSTIITTTTGVPMPLLDDLAASLTYLQQVDPALDVSHEYATR